MNVTTITMDPKLAEAKVASYRTALRRRADTEYEGAAEGYAALAKGTPLVNLPDVFRNCPLDAFERPRLAVARADRRRVGYTRRGSSRAEFSTQIRNYRGRDLVFTFDIKPLPPGYELPWAWRSASTTVPMLPADIRLTVQERLGHALRLDRYLTLFEVERWEDRAQRDPFLLRHLAGDLYVVEAEWALTELERAIVAGRAL